MEKQQVFELSKHGNDLRIRIENMSKLDVMNTLSNFLEGLTDEKVLDAEDILACLFVTVGEEELNVATDKVIRSLGSKKGVVSVGNKRFN